MNILLILPPNKRLLGIQEPSFHLGLAYLASVLHREGHNVHIYNTDLDPEREKFKIDDASTTNSEQQMRANLELYKIPQILKDKKYPLWKEISEKLQEYKPDIVGLSVTSVTYDSALKIASICRECDKDIKIIAGGHQATTDPEGLLKSEYIDFVVRGEGEETVKELITSIEKANDGLSSINGLSYKNNGNFIHNRPRKLIDNLDSIPFPARDLLIDIDKHPDIFNVAVTGISRGCPWRCGFCSSSATWGRNVRFRSIENVIKEIRLLINRYGAKKIYFYDDTFTLKRNKVIEFCDKVISEQLKLKWICMSRADCLDDELLKKMKSSGCQSIVLGIESGSERMLKFIRKEVNLTKIRETINLIKKNGIWVSTFFMVGFPTETKEDMLKTFGFMKEIGSNELYLSTYKPNPKTELHDYIIKNKNISPEWLLQTHYDTSRNCEFIEGLSETEYKNLLEEMFSFIFDYNKKQHELLLRGLSA